VVVTVMISVVSVRIRVAHRDATSDTQIQARYVNIRNVTLPCRVCSTYV